MSRVRILEKFRRDFAVLVHIIAASNGDDQVRIGVRDLGERHGTTRCTGFAQNGEASRGEDLLGDPMAGRPWRLGPFQQEGAWGDLRLRNTPPAARQLLAQGGGFGTQRPNESLHAGSK